MSPSKSLSFNGLFNEILLTESPSLISKDEVEIPSFFGYSESFLKTLMIPFQLTILKNPNY
jgi:hypothetical protein